MKINKNFFLVVLSIFLSLLLIEFFFYFKFLNINKNYKFSLHNQRYMLFDEGSVFINIDEIFKYHPNKRIISKTYYNINNNWVKEYEYEILTNNFGLVQENDLKKNTPSILFLGDSFVEGQGAYAWINKFGGKFKDYQIINGGIIGTGPQQFELLEKHISKSFKLDKLIFFYIGDDIRRNVYNISKNTLECLQNYKKCQGNENFYGFPLKSEDPLNFLNFLKNYRSEVNKNIPLYEKYKLNLKNFFLNLNIVKLTKNFLRQNFYISKNEYIQRNFKSIKNLINKYNDSIIFIQLKNKNEIIFGKEYDTYYAENYIKELSNNHHVCNFENNISNFYEIDMHPNKRGYESLFNCVNMVLKNHFK